MIWNMHVEMHGSWSAATSLQSSIMEVYGVDNTKQTVTPLQFHVSWSGTNSTLPPGVSSEFVTTPIPNVTDDRHNINKEVTSRFFISAKLHSLVQPARISVLYVMVEIGQSQ